MSVPKYRTTFAAQIRAVEPTEREVKEVKASLTDLKGLLPAGIDPEQDYDLLYVAADLAVAGLVNLNDDGIDLETGLAVYKQFERRFCDIEHERDRICGYILHAGLTEFGTDRVITEAEARAANKPYNIATVAVLWRVANPDLCDYIEDASNPTHVNYKDLSLSFELGFQGYRIIGLPEGDKVIANAKLIIPEESPEYPKYDELLRYRGGSGIMPQDAKGRLYRVLDKGAKPLGQGVVTVPAAAVKGITPILEQPTPPAPPAANADDDAYAEPDVNKLDEACPVDLMHAMAVAREWSNCLVTRLESAAASIISDESCVSVSTVPLSHMNKTDIKSFKDKVAKASKLEEMVEAMAGANSLIDAIVAEADRLATEKANAEAQAATILKNKQESEAAAAALSETLKAVQAELANIKSAQAAAEAAAKFQERMAAVEDVFALEGDSETRAYLVEEIKACESDEIFAKKMDKFKKVMKEKTKDFKKKQDDDAKARLDQIQAALAEKGIKTSVKDNAFNIDSVLASAASNPVDANLPNNVEEQKSLRKQAEDAFRSSLSVAGKKLVETAKK